MPSDTSSAPSPDKCYVYHITHVSNLPSILAGGLLCDDASAQLKQSPMGIAYASLKARRARKVVPVIGGTLSSYVPFYFCNRSPMLAAISRQRVDAYQGGQNPIIYLVSTVQREMDAGLI